MDTLISSTNSFLIEPTKVTPYVAFHSQQALLEIRGVSSPNDTLTFYAPILTFIESLPSFQIDHLNVQISLLYFNSSSAKALFMIFKKIASLQDTVTNKIDWFCDEEDEDMMENVEDFNEILDLNINLITGKLDG